ncbi:protein kinase domain-containing protein [Fibrella forsythiae]|uniref:non-specific serine/threonine protein kinase n=1 Tax=Fibrella forsythiae TaxID=2817061 RepID=A0ABS3JL61_9BACT|nr:protein kinase [Fibrella forsythiae]MBO0950752.1 protein kinase [Fibrella forsythiae]
MEYRKQQFLTYDEFTRQFACDYAMPLARGGHGEIYRGVDLETNEEVAIKRRLYSVDDNALTLEKEYANTQAVPVNRFVVRYLYYGRYATPFGTYEFLVMRYYRDGNLTNTALSWAGLSNLQQQRFVSEFLLGLSHLHTHGIVHRDIKPENVLLVRYSDSEGIAYRPVIVDFGISKMMTDHPEAARAFVQNSMRIGTVTYMAPEQLRTENIDYNADLWSFGIILYELITGKHMIARKSFPETQREEAYAFWRMATEERFPDDLRTVPQPYQQLIRKCLIVSPDERVQSARALLDLLELQPRINDAEQAFRRQNWEAVIEALDPVVDKADIPELTARLQQARMQAALIQPINQLVEEPPTNTADNVPDREAEAATLPDPTGTPEQPESNPESKPVPYTAQTELFDSSVDPFLPGKSASAVDENSPADTPDSPARLGSAPISSGTYPEAFGNVPGATQHFTAEFDPSMEIEEQASANETIDAGQQPEAEIDRAISEPTAAIDDLPTPASAMSAVTEPASDWAEPKAAANNVPDQAADHAAPDGEQHTEAFTPVHTEVGKHLVTKPATTNVPEPPKNALAPATSLIESTKSRLKKVATRFDSDRVNKRVGEVYEAAKKSKNRPLLIGGVVVILLLLLFAVDTEPSANGSVVQLDPNESYATSLKRFQQYSRTYEKTGELNPYVWAFVHCNPVYDDSLRKSAVRRAELIRTQHELLFGTYSEDISKLKRMEMKKMSNNQVSWEIRPRSLSDENCLPKK